MLTGLSEYIDLAALAVAVAALVVSTVSVASASRQQETATLLDTFERYENYSRALLSASTEAEQRLAFANLLNFMENLCFIDNRKLASGGVAAVVRNLAVDFIGGASARYDLDAVITKFSLGSDSFLEIAKFRKRYRRRIHRKRVAFQGTVYEEAALEVQAH